MQRRDIVFAREYHKKKINCSVDKSSTRISCTDISTFYRREQSQLDGWYAKWHFRLLCDACSNGAGPSSNKIILSAVQVSGIRKWKLLFETQIVLRTKGQNCRFISIRLPKKWPSPCRSTSVCAGFYVSAHRSTSKCTTTLAKLASEPCLFISECLLRIFRFNR